MKTFKQRKQHAWVFITRWIIPGVIGNLRRYLYSDCVTPRTWRCILRTIDQLQRLRNLVEQEYRAGKPIKPQ